MHRVLVVVLMSVTLSCTSAASESDRVEIDLTYEPPKPPELECEPADPSDPNYDPVYRPWMKRSPGFCGRDLSDMERHRCEAVISFQFGDGRRVAESNVDIKSGRDSCKHDLESWIPEWRLCPDAPDPAYSGKLLVILCDPRMMPDKPSKPVEPENSEELSEPSPILDGIDMMLKQTKPLYDMIFGND